MEVPNWLLILLTIFSALLLIFAAVCTFIIVKNWCRMRSYQRLKSYSSSDKKLKNKATPYGGWDDDPHYTFIPLTFASTIQSGSERVTRASSVVTSGRSSPAEDFRSRNEPHRSNSIRSYSRERGGTFEKRPNQRDVVLDRCFSLDDRAFRKHLHTRSLNESVRFPTRPTSPPTPYREHQSITTSPTSPRQHDDSNSTDGAQNMSDPVSSGNAPGAVISPEEVYLHSSFLPELSGPAEDDPVISYDQKGNVNNESKYPGALSFVLQYDSQLLELSITVKQAFDLPAADGDKNGEVNCYVNLCLVPEDFLWKRTNLVKNSRFPTFSETFLIQDVLHHKLREYTLCFFLMDVSDERGERVIGKILYPLSDLRAGPQVEACVELLPQ